MAVSDWSTTAANNKSIASIGIDEGMAPGDVDNAIREMMAEIATYAGARDAAFATGTVSALVSTRTYATQALLYADLAHNAGDFALVYADSTITKNDLYVKAGASGSGSWSAPLGLFASAANSYAVAAAASAATAAAVLSNQQTRQLMGMVPRGLVALWPVDRLAAGSIPNLIDGTGNITTAGSVTAGVFNGTGTIAFPAAKTMKAFTFQALVRMTALHTYNAILYDSANFFNFSFHSASNLVGTGVPVNPRNSNNMLCGQASTGYQTQVGGFTDIIGDGFKVITARNNEAGRLSIWIDDLEIYVADGYSTAPLTFQNLNFNVGPDTVPSANDLAGFIGFWDRGLSDEEVRQSAYAQRAYVEPYGIVPTERANRMLIVNGTSLDGAFDSNQWFWQFAAHDSPKNYAASYAISGSTITGITARAALIKGIVPPQIYGRKLIYALGGPTNDIPGYNPTTVISTLVPLVQAHMLDMKSVGYQNAMGTVGSRGDLTGAALTNFDATRAALNAYMLANPTTFGLASSAQIADIGSVTGIGSTFDATKFAVDKLHHNAAGGALAEAVWRAALNAL